MNCAGDPAKRRRVFGAGIGPHRFDVSVCPSRILADDELGALAIAEWWLLSTVPEPLTGDRPGPPDWPFPGGLWHQPARLVDAVQILRAEWPHVFERRKPKETPPDPDPTKALRKRRPKR